MSEGRIGAGPYLVDLADENGTSLDTLKYARRRYNRSVKSGHVFREFDATQKIEDVMRINNSSSMRQGKRIAETYINEEQVKAIAREQKPSFGVFSAEGKLLAYTHAPIIGDAFVYSRIGVAIHIESSALFRLACV